MYDDGPDSFEDLNAFYEFLYGRDSEAWEEQLNNNPNIIVMTETSDGVYEML